MPAPHGAGLETRRTRVGASEVAALVEPGCHPYTDPASIYARIVHGWQRPVAGTRVQLGIDLESYVARRWAALEGRKVLAAWRTYAHPDVPLAATPDYYVPPDALLECKVDRGGPSDVWVDLPRYVYWQVQAQLLCTGRDMGYVAALVGSDVRRFTVPADPADAARLVCAVHAFDVQHLMARIPPEPVPDDLLFTILPIGPDVADVDGDDIADVGSQLVALRRDVGAADAHLSQLRAVIARHMADNGLRLLRGPDWRAEVQDRDGKPQLVIHDLTRTYRRSQPA